MGSRVVNTERERQELKQKLLDALNLAGGYTFEACKEAGVTLSQYRHWRERDAEFRRETDKIIINTKGSLEAQHLSERVFDDIRRNLPYRLLLCDGSIREACEMSGVNHERFFRWRIKYPEFDEACENALRAYADKAKELDDKINRILIEFPDVLRKNLGMEHEACRHFGITMQEYRKFRDRYDEFSAACDEALDMTGDFVESKLFELIKKGNPSAIMFYCKTKLKHRGYADAEVAKTINQPVQLSLTLGNDQDILDNYVAEKTAKPVN